MGDDLPDLGALRLAGLATCPNDAVEAVRERADWIAPLPGGSGAVRALADFILQSQGRLSDVIRLSDERRCHHLGYGRAGHRTLAVTRSQIFTRPKD